MTKSNITSSLTAAQKSALLRDVKSNPSRFVVFIGEASAILDTANDIAQGVSRTVALAAVQYGRMKIEGQHRDGLTFAASVPS